MRASRSSWKVARGGVENAPLVIRSSVGGLVNINAAFKKTENE